MKLHRQTRKKVSLPPTPADRLRLLFCLVAFACWAVPAAFAAAQDNDNPPSTAGRGQLILGEATVCEQVKKGIPYHSAVAFSVSLGRIYCFTDFIDVEANTVIYHNWYHRDEKRTSVKLAVRPPRWATFSSITLRDSDKGPWQVEITAESGEVLKILRFSVID